VRTRRKKGKKSGKLVSPKRRRKGTRGEVHECYALGKELKREHAGRSLLFKIQEKREGRGINGVEVGVWQVQYHWLLKE